jgi:hypothetical protein
MISPGLTLKKHQAIKIEILANENKIMSFLNCFVNIGTLRTIIITISIKNKIRRSKIFGKIKVIMLRINTIDNLVIGCNLTKIEFKGI